MLPIAPPMRPPVWRYRNTFNAVNLFMTFRPNDPGDGPLGGDGITARVPADLIRARRGQAHSPRPKSVPRDPREQLVSKGSTKGGDAYENTHHDWIAHRDAGPCCFGRRLRGQLRTSLPGLARRQQRGPTIAEIAGASAAQGAQGGTGPSQVSQPSLHQIVTEPARWCVQCSEPVPLVHGGRPIPGLRLLE